MVGRVSRIRGDYRANHSVGQFEPRLGFPGQRHVIAVPLEGERVIALPLPWGAPSKQDAYAVELTSKLVLLLLLSND